MAKKEENGGGGNLAVVYRYLSIAKRSPSKSERETRESQECFYNTHSNIKKWDGEETAHFYTVRSDRL